MADDKPRLVTPEFRLAFPAIFEAKENMSGKLMFSCTMLFEKGTDLSVLEKAVRREIRSKFGRDEDEWPTIKMPFLDQGDHLKWDGHVAGAVMIRPTSTEKPGVVDRDNQDIFEKSELYAGCYCIATLNVFIWEQPGDKFGVSFGVNNIQKVRDGESLSGRTKATDDFSPLGDMDDGDFDDDDD